MTETTIHLPDEPEADLGPVDAAVLAEHRKPDTDRRPIVPVWVSDRTARRSGFRWAVENVAYAIAFHALRLPLYVGRCLMYAPVGLFRLGYALCWWAVDAGTAEVRNAMTISLANDSRAAGPLAQMDARHYRRVHWRVSGVLVSGLIATAVLLFGWDAVSASVRAAVSALALVLLAMSGSPQDKRLVDSAAVSSSAPALTSGLIIEALSSLGLGKMGTALTKGDKVEFVAPITREKSGFRADINLPKGITANEIIDRRESLASGLRRPLGCVWPERDRKQHEGRLVLHVTDKPMGSDDRVPWPMAEPGATANVFRPIPIGVDHRGEPVEIIPMFASGLIGAIPRVGKTFLLRLICLGAALDERVQSYIFNLKGGPDFEAFRHTAHVYRAGDTEDDLKAALAALLAVQVEMGRRYELLRTLPKHLCPESKITDRTASMAEFGLFPILIAVDECQMWFDNDEYGREFEKLAEDLVKRGPAVGIMSWFSTQRPDKKSIPGGIRDNAVIRFCLKVTSQVMNDMVLGTSMYKAGYRATVFDREDYGVAWLVGNGEPRIVQVAYVDNRTAEDITLRARARKKAAGFLSGAAIGEDIAPDTDTGSILDHLMAVWPAGHEKVPNQVLAERLAEQFPEMYAGWTGKQITDAVRPHGIEKTTQIKRLGSNLRGITFDQLMHAVGERLDRA